MFIFSCRSQIDDRNFQLYKFLEKVTITSVGIYELDWTNLKPVKCWTHVISR